MAARENTEADLLDLELRRQLYGNTTTYSFECGGKTEEILKLTRQDIIDYHSIYYDATNITIILTGNISEDAVFKRLSEFEDLFSSRNMTPTPTIPINPDPLADKFTLTTTSVKFPSDDMDVGSIGYAWRGPPTEDVITCTSLDILLRYLNDSSASPFFQEFVERDDPLASDVDFELRAYSTSALILIFSGVPYHESSNDVDGDEDGIPMDDGDEEWEDEEDEELQDEESDEEMEEDEDEPEEMHNEGKTTTEDLFGGDVFYQKLRGCLQNQVDSFDYEKLKAAIRRHIRKCTEGAEEDPHETVAGLMIPDIVRHYFSQCSLLNDTKYQGGTPKIGTRAPLFSILNDLLSKPKSYWIQLLRRWLIDQPMFEVKMTPDSQFALDIARKQETDFQNRVRNLGEDGLAVLKKQSEKNAQKSVVELSKNIIEAMPPIPKISSENRILAESEIVSLAPTDEVCRSFIEAQVIQTETSFASVRLGLNLGSVPEHLRVYLVLFQELLFQSDMNVVSDNGALVRIQDYRELVETSAELLNTYEASIGFGNELWHTSWLGEVFFISANSESGRCEEMYEHVLRVLMFSKFTEERVMTIAKNLLSELMEIKRDGSEMLTAVTSHVLSLSSKERTEPNDAISEKMDQIVSIFTQESFLKGVVKSIKENKGKDIIEALKRVQTHIIGFRSNDELKVGPSFVQLSLPLGSSSNVNRRQVGEKFAKLWEKLVRIYIQFNSPVSPSLLVADNSTPKTNKKPRLKSKKDQPETLNEKSIIPGRNVSSAFPYPRNCYDLCYRLWISKYIYYSSLLVPIAGLSTSFLNQVVACDVLNTDDYFPAELLSRAEGPLYTAIRGKGYAYDASLHVALWSGTITFTCTETTDPVSALQEFYKIISQLQTPAGFDEICSDFHIETAIASVLYKNVAGKSTAGSCVFSGIRSALQGFLTLDQVEANEKKLYEVNKKDLERVYNTYFAAFLNPTETRVTVLVTSPGKTADDLKNSFSKLSFPDALRFEKKTLSELKL
ncbi:hypothetical protein HK098_001966 [Nowakowskiella sp. JEL0407]|nr:hypothetical protein HK098_001966 [Nowakowskiella sp. JEL0407]